MLFAYEYAQHMLADQEQLGAVQFVDKLRAASLVAFAIGREVASFHRVMRESSSPTRGYAASATIIAVRYAFGSDKLINQLVDLLQEGDSRNDSTKILNDRVKAKILAEDCILLGVNAVIDKSASWCERATSAVKQYFETSFQTERVVTHDEVERWEKQYHEQVQKSKTKAAITRTTTNPIASSAIGTGSTTAENEDAKYGCLGLAVALPFFLVGLAIHPLLGLMIGAVVAVAVVAIAKEVGIGQTIFGAGVICYILYKFISKI